MKKVDADAFMREFSIPWPSGYGLTDESMANLGVVTSLTAYMGYGAAPTLFLVGPDGKVRWSDEGSRQRHKHPNEAIAKLEKAIENALEEK